MTAPQDAIAAHVAGTRFEHLPPEAVAKVKTFLLDTLGVGIAGSSGAGVEDLIRLARAWGPGEESTVWLSGERISAGSAAIVNAYQIHCLEFDCVHEGAVLHPMATILSAVLAWAERESAHGHPVAGRDLVAALAVGVDVSTMLGQVTNAPIRFFRPATAGGFGACAAIASLARLSGSQVKDAFGAQYAQTSGTLQPHVEGSPMLGMQVGFNARAAVQAVDLARAGFRGPHDVFTGPYGYLTLWEGNDHDLQGFLPSLGRDWQILRMSHKPYPSGRLTHGTITGLLRLRAEHGFSASEVESVVAEVPPLPFRLTGRPDIPDPAPNYAKLCTRFVAATYLLRGRVDVPDFLGDALRAPDVHELASRINVVQTDNPDLNAFDPQRVTVLLRDGRTLAAEVPRAFGHPEDPLTHEQNEEKFRRCLGHAREPVPAAQADAIVEAVSRLESLEDASLLARLTWTGAGRAAA